MDRLHQSREKGVWFTFTVEGSGVFPLEMICQDDCWPKANCDSAAALGDKDRPLRRVVLVTRSDDAPTISDWYVHGWHYIGGGELRDVRSHPTPSIGARL